MNKLRILNDTNDLNLLFVYVDLRLFNICKYSFDSVGCLLLSGVDDRCFCCRQVIWFVFECWVFFFFQMVFGIRCFLLVRRWSPNGMVNSMFFGHRMHQIYVGSSIFFFIRVVVTKIMLVHSHHNNRNSLFFTGNKAYFTGNKIYSKRMLNCTLILYNVFIFVYCCVYIWLQMFKGCMQ